VEVDGRPFLQIRPRGGNGRRAGVGEWEAAADLERGGRAGRAGVGGWQAAPDLEEEGGPAEQALGDGSGVGREEGGAWRGKADAISETRGKARFFGYAAGDG